MSFSNDPLADFLAREKDEFAGLEDEDTNFDDLNNKDTAPVVNGYTGVVNGHTSLDDEFLNVTAGDITAASVGDTQSAVAPDAPTPFSAPTSAIRPEPEKIRKWREEQKIRIENMDLQEETDKEKWRALAKKELQEWYATRGDQIEATKKNNKLAEEEFMRERDNVKPGQEWERIARLCEFNPKAAKNVKDVSRMRSLLLQMKTQPGETGAVSTVQ